MGVGRLNKEALSQSCSRTPLPRKQPVAFYQCSFHLSRLSESSCHSKCLLSTWNPGCECNAFVPNACHTRVLTLAADQYPFPMEPNPHIVPSCCSLIYLMIWLESHCNSTVIGTDWQDPPWEGLCLFWLLQIRPLGPRRVSFWSEVMLSRCIILKAIRLRPQDSQAWLSNRKLIWFSTDSGGMLAESWVSNWDSSRSVKGPKPGWPPFPLPHHYHSHFSPCIFFWIQCESWCVFSPLSLFSYFSVRNSESS